MAERPSPASCDQETAPLDETGRLAPGGRREQHLEAGALINGRYRVQRTLGAGGMGVVYLVADELHGGRPLALKTIRGDAIEAHHLGLFKAEFRTMATLHHPNVVRALDFEPWHGSPDHLFTMEYVPGADVLQATAGRDWPSILGLVVQICRSLSYVHSRGLVHFDIKPSNVRVTEDDQVKVLDFGVARARLRSGIAGFTGTPHYMAPELGVPDAGPDHRADLYSLGITTFRLLTRRLPFDAPTAAELWVMHSRHPLCFTEAEQEVLPDWLRQLVTRLCAKQPADRFRTASAVLEAINRDGEMAFAPETHETRESYVLSSRFVGRAEALDRLNAYVGERTAGSGRAPRVAFVAGQSGVGKSRLMREVRHQAQLARLPFVESNCYDGALDEYAPIADLLSHCVRLARGVGATDLVDVHREVLATLVPGLGQGPPPLEHQEAEQRRLAEGASAFVVGLAERTPLVLYVNDLQWASVGTIALLRHLVLLVASRERAGRPVRVALVGSYRDDEVPGRPVQGLLAELEERGGGVVESLQVLGEEDVGRLLASMLGLEALPGDFVGRVARTTLGNPYFVEEVMRNLVADGSVYLEDGRWTATRAVDVLEIPQSMTAAFMRRFDHLEPRTQRILEVMAAYGKPMAGPVLVEVLGDEQALYDGLAVLQKRQMILAGTDAGRLVYAVNHDRMREALYEGMEAERRQELHGRIGRSLEGMAAGSSETAYELAQHFWLSADRDKALRYCLAAADQARDAYAAHLGAELYGRVLALLPEDDPRREELVEARADQQTLAGDYDAAVRTYEALLATHRSIPDRARLERKLGTALFQMGALREALERFERATQLLGGARVPRGPLLVPALAGALGVRVWRAVFGSPPPPRVEAEAQRLRERWDVMSRASPVYFYLSEMNRFRLASLRQADLAERVGDREAAVSLSALAFMYAMHGLHRPGASAIDRALRAAEQSESAFHLGAVLCYRSALASAAGDTRGALGDAERALALLRDLGDQWQLSFALTCLAWGRWGLGEYRGHRAIAIEAGELMERTGSVTLGKQAWSGVAVSSAMIGEFDEEAERAADRAMALSVETNDQFAVSMAERGCGCVELQRSDWAAAIHWLSQARQTVEGTGNVNLYNADVYALLARAGLERALEAGEGDLAPVARAVRRARALGWMFPLHRSPALASAGLLAWLQGRRSRALRRLQGAVEAAEHVHNPAQLADALYVQGRCLAEGGDPHAARKSCGRALEHAERIGLRPLVSRLRVLEDAIGGEDQSQSS